MKLQKSPVQVGIVSDFGIIVRCNLKRESSSVRLCDVNGLNITGPEKLVMLSDWICVQLVDAFHDKNWKQT